MKLTFDPEKVMAGLKDFQRRTVAYVFRRMYEDDDQTRRFLVADEVGLGKTLVARGLIARVVEHLWDDIDRIDVIYICSNADIARQNINRLNITDSDDFVLSSRITLLPTQLEGLNENKLNFVSFTPGTSFNLRSTLGRQSERVLLYWLLDQAWEISGWGTGPKNVLRGYASAENFRAGIKRFEPETIDSKLAKSFLCTLRSRVEEAQANGEEDFRTLFEDLSDRFQWKRRDDRIPERDKRDRTCFVGALRAMLAQTCLQELEPDLIILDEFQRFKHLLGGEDEASVLARQLFNYSDKHTKARVLLLSATPYKMYTLSHERDDNHYEDFIDTLRFLQHDPERTERFRIMLSAYRREMLRIQTRGMKHLLSKQQEIERELKRFMVRTERLADSPDRNGMLREMPSRGATLKNRDIDGYLRLQRVAQFLNHRDPVAYWKSSPYLLSFMNNYKLKEAFEAIDLDERPSEELSTMLEEAEELFLPWEAIQTYKQIEPSNARLRHLISSTVERGMWQLLWMPPSLSYYRLEVPFAGKERLTKRLIFSAWRVVPRAIAALVSYETERRIFRSYEETPTYSAHQDFGPLLNFTESNERLTGMPVLGVLYPAVTLARIGDPLNFVINGEKPTPSVILKEVERRVQMHLDKLSIRWEEEAPVDEAWYWAAPILLDLHYEKASTQEWFQQERLPVLWAADDEDMAETDWAKHVEAARRLLKDRQLGRPPDDLASVLAQLSVGGPATCSLRALSRGTASDDVVEDPCIRNAAAKVAWGFRQLFNKPEAIAVIRGLNRKEPYWRRLVEYAVAGCLQAVLDEYAHILRESLGLLDHDMCSNAQEIAEEILRAIGLRTVSLGVDEIKMEDTKITMEDRRMRTHFALRFGDEKDEYAEERTRADQVRVAFNSPFWPFVLATTSVGQEGLDFHQYCHAVVHWNLPSNPVDLEQREGRVHRYKGHAVRKNVAFHHGHHLAAVDNGVGDPWSSLFELARDDNRDAQTEMWPYWIYPIEGGAQIERYVPALPLSRDLQRLSDLRRSLAVYRMVFGQSRQEELIEYLMQFFDEEQIGRMVEEIRVDLTPPEIREIKE